MVKVNKIRAIIVENGMNQEEVANKMGISPQTFYRKMKKGVFNSDEINRMIEILDIKDPAAIFFAREVT